jgi:hypothetical protein
LNKPQSQIRRATDRSSPLDEESGVDRPNQFKALVKFPGQSSLGKGHRFILSNTGGVIKVLLVIGSAFRSALSEILQMIHLLSRALAKLTVSVASTGCHFVSTR